MKRTAGFTLLELMVAVAVLAVMGAMAHQGIGALARNAAAASAASERFGELSFAMTMLERDIRGATARPVRDLLGAKEPALLGQAETLTLTRTGWDNPLAQNRATLQRVTWTRRGDVLTRVSWPVLDRSQSTLPLEQPLLEGVNSVTLEFVARRGEEWTGIWPPPLAVEALREPWPQGIRITLDVEGFGRVERIFSLAGDAP
ncbi:MAG: type II secretion system minor pseudopilin GspJ [Pseudomonadota bacterium]